MLIWTNLPSANTPPDLVLGQKDFITNNDRILIWNSFPSENGIPADVVLELPRLSGTNSSDQKDQRPQIDRNRPQNPGNRPNSRPRPGGQIQRFGWPWGVWSDGKKFAVVCTHGSVVLIWNSIPTRDNQEPDLILRPSDTGTPRNITSDGTFFALSDHNHGEQSRPATAVWLTFPTSSYQPPDFTWNEWVKGTFTPDHKLVTASMRSISIWNRISQSIDEKPQVVLQPACYKNGDGPDVVFAGGRLYVCNYNGNNVLVWNKIPMRNEAPDFSLGSDTPEQDTLSENFFITNPVLATDGQSLFISSDFDRKLHVWRHLPDQSGAKPDITYDLPDAPWDNALCGQTLVLAGKQTVYLWKRLPLKGELPDVVFRGRIGNVQFREITGVALDEKYLYISDRQANRINVWDGIPTNDSEPKFSIEMNEPGRLSSDSRYFAAAPFAG